MKTITASLTLPILKKWFYILAVALIAYPIIEALILYAIYRGRLAPSYNASLIEQLPLLVLLALQFLLQFGLLAAAIMLALRVKTAWKRIVLYGVGLVALLFVYFSLRILVLSGLFIS